MSARYEFACQCGRKIPVETSQAGQEILCECGATLKIPTMLKIKRLPLWNEADESNGSNGQNGENGAANFPQFSAGDGFNTASSKDAAASQSSSNATKSRLSSQRLGLLIVGGLVLVVSSFFFCRNIHQPNPLDVFYKQQTYSIDGKTIRRDSSPIEGGDFDFYFLHDPGTKTTYLVGDALIDQLNYMHSYLYFDAVKELKLSDNFYDNYETLKTRRAIRLVSLGIAAAFGLALALFALFAPESKKQVGAMRGNDWR